jgi:thymidylate synthase
LTSRNELFALHDLLTLILREGRPNGNYLEILNCLMSVEYQPTDWQQFRDFRKDFLRVGGDVAKTGWRRASKVYTVAKDSPAKPSYIKRLIDYPDQPRRAVTEQGGLDQLAKIAFELAKKPGYSNLSFVFLRPADLHDQFRPGYVPCPIAGDFKFREGKLQLSVMFRTNDAFAVGYADLYYLRQIQLDVLNKAQDLPGATYSRTVVLEI